MKEIIWACLLAVAVAALYAHRTGTEYLLILVYVVGVVLWRSGNVRVRLIDWSILSLAVLEFLSLCFSSYGANGMVAVRTIVLTLLLFFAIRLTFRTPVQHAGFGAVLAFGGAWLAVSGLHQFAAEADRLMGAGFADLLAFRSRLVTPPSPWLPGEWFTLVLLTLPFACSLPVFLWRRGRKWSAAVTLLLPLVVRRVAQP